MSEQGIEKLIKASKKEGGKLGIDLTGAAELGGTEYFVCDYCMFFHLFLVHHYCECRRKLRGPHCC